MGGSHRPAPAGQPVSGRGGRADGRAPRPAAPPEGRRRELVPAARAAVVAEARSWGCNRRPSGSGWSGSGGRARH